MYEVETIEYRNHTIRVCYDEDPLNPRRDWDNFGTMVCFHGRYDLGDDKDSVPSIDPSDFESFDEMETYLHEHEDAAVVLPLSLYDHSGITMFVGEASGWDCGQVGFIFVTRKQILENYNRKRLSKKLLERVREHLKAEVETYDQYLRGEVYGYMVEGEDCDDSCWGFFDRDYMVEEAKGNIDYSIRQLDLPLPQSQPSA